MALENYEHYKDAKLLTTLRTLEALLDTSESGDEEYYKEERILIQKKLAAVKAEIQRRRDSHSNPEPTLPSLPSPTRRSLFGQRASPASMNHYQIADSRSRNVHSDSAQSEGFGAYAGNSNGSFGDLSASQRVDGAGCKEQGGLSLDNGPSWSFGGARTMSNGSHWAGTPATSSSGSGVTPPSVELPPTHLSESSHNRRKRHRESVGSSPHVSKTLKATPSPAATRPDTPPSRESGFSSDIPPEIIELLGCDPREEKRRMQKLEDEIAQRRERENADAEFARKLEAEINGQNLPASQSAPRNTFQCTFNAEGGYNRHESSSQALRPSMLQDSNRLPSIGNSIQQQSSHRSSTPNLSRSFKSERSPMRPPVQPSFSSNTQPPARKKHQVYQDLGSDDDLEIVDGSHFVPNHRRQTPHRGNSIRPGSRSSTASENVPITDLTGSSPITHRSRQLSTQPLNGYHGSATTPVYGQPSHQYMVPGSGNNPRPHPSSMNMGRGIPDPSRPHPSYSMSMGSSIHANRGASYPGMSMASRTGSNSQPPHPGQAPISPRSHAARMMDPMAAAYGMLNTARDSLSTLGHSLMSHNQPVYGHLPGSSGTQFDPFILNDLMESPFQSLWDREDGFRDKDPKKTAEELRDLMNNIRPDEELGADDRTGSPEDMAEGCALYEHQKLGVSWMINMEEGTNKGGILADDMGLGKTIQAIALMVSRRSEDSKCKTNLIVAPVALLKQWEHEIKVKVKPNKRLSTFIYHGSSKKGTNWTKLRQFDVVLTTYGTVSAELAQKEGIDHCKKSNPSWIPTAPNHFLTLLGDECNFYRIFLDEAQNIKNRNTKSAKAAFALKARSRFCMTGTPMMNGTHELYSLVCFLQIRPYHRWERFNQDFVRPVTGTSSVDKADDAMKKLQAFLKAVLLRRTKKSEINGKPILDLPERITVTDHAVFDEEQKAFYQGLESGIQTTFNRYREAGTVGKNYGKSLVLLLRLRQACCHPHLIREYEAATNLTPVELENFASQLEPDVIRRIKEEGLVDCPICMDVVENSTIFIPCGHRTCAECFARISDPTLNAYDGHNGPEHTFKCMSCRREINPKKITDYASFQKTHMSSETNEPEATNSGSESESESDSDSDSGSDSDDEIEDDETGSLDGFIVDDDKDEEVEEASGGEDDDTASLSSGRLTPSAKPQMSDIKKGKRAVKPNDKDEEIQEDGDQKTWKQLKQARKSAKAAKKAKRKSKGKKKGKGKSDGKKSLSQLQKEGRRNVKAKKKYMIALREDWVSSCKVDKCMEILDQIQARGEGEKTIIFSQFTTMLDLLEIPMTDKGYLYKRYDGSMQPQSRNDAVLEFQHRSRCTVMLVSLKAGNSGLNLTAANNVIMFDPFWNPYIEDQAVDRAHRIGQRRTVNVHRLLIEETVEDRIIQLQEKKRSMIEGALDENASKSIARLGERELAFLFGLRS